MNHDERRVTAVDRGDEESRQHVGMPAGHDPGPHQRAARLIARL